MTEQEARKLLKAEYDREQMNLASTKTCKKCKKQYLEVLSLTPAICPECDKLDKKLNRKGISFINDTTATIPDASIAAIKRFRLLAKKSHLILIAGGSDKQLKFFEMAHLISLSVDYLILLPGTATNQLLYELTKKKISHVFSLQKTESMQEAVRIAMALAKKGDYVLLSPGAASFGLFANEFDRGNQFVAAVKSLNEKI